MVPFMRRLDERRVRSLGLGTLRPWDLAVDEKGGAPLRPFDRGQDLIEKTRRMFDAIHPEMGEMFASLGENMAPDGCLNSFGSNSVLLNSCALVQHLLNDLSMS